MAAHPKAKPTPSAPRTVRTSASPAQWSESVRIDMIMAGAIIGGAVAFVAIGAWTALAWVLLGAAIGGVIGYVVRRYTRRAHAYTAAVDMAESSTRTELYEQAKKLEVPGRSSMDRDQLATAIAEQLSEKGPQP